MQKVEFLDLGLIDYAKAWDLQQQFLKELVDNKRLNYQKEKEGLPIVKQAHKLLFCEHPHVYTLGKSGSLDNLLLNEQELEAVNARFYKINRGGDITYHGPGQLVGYPIFDLECFFTDVHKYVRFLEEAIIQTLKIYGIESGREDGFTGVWLPSNKQQPKRKICAIGVHLSRWVTMHGFAFNVNTNLDYFKNIIPCGIDEPDKDVTSLETELGKKIDIKDVQNILKNQFAQIFNFEFA